MVNGWLIVHGFFLKWFLMVFNVEYGWILKTSINGCFKLDQQTKKCGEEHRKGVSVWTEEGGFGNVFSSQHVTRCPYQQRVGLKQGKWFWAPYMGIMSAKTTGVQTKELGMSRVNKNSGSKVKGATKSAISFLCRTAPDPFQYPKWIV